MNCNCPRTFTGVIYKVDAQRPTIHFVNSTHDPKPDTEASLKWPSKQAFSLFSSKLTVLCVKYHCRQVYSIWSPAVCNQSVKFRMCCALSTSRCVESKCRHASNYLYRVRRYCSDVMSIFWLTLCEMWACLDEQKGIICEWQVDQQVKWTFAIK